MNSFEEIAKQWLKSQCYGDKYSYRQEKKNAVSHLLKYFGKKYCEEIKSIDVEKFIKYESEHINPNTGKAYSKRILIDHINVGNSIFEFALDNELIDCRNPFQRKRRRIPKNAPVKERTQIDDIQKDLILKVYNRTQIAALIMLYCGLRRGEIIPLEWKDIDCRISTQTFLLELHKCSCFFVIELLSGKLHSVNQICFSKTLWRLCFSFFNLNISIYIIVHLKNRENVLAFGHSIYFVPP